MAIVNYDITTNTLDSEFILYKMPNEFSFYSNLIRFDSKINSTSQEQITEILLEYYILPHQ